MKTLTEAVANVLAEDEKPTDGMVLGKFHDGPVKLMVKKTGKRLDAVLVGGGDTKPLIRDINPKWSVADLKSYITKSYAARISASGGLEWKV